MQAIGLDIGTTTVCGIVLDAGSGEVLSVRTCENDAQAEGRPFERLQDPERIWALVQEIYGEFVKQYGEIACIGLTGQMHGIVYLDGDGKAVSPLYTWQDERGNESAEEQACGLTQDVPQTCAERFAAKTGCPAASGFGMVTHYYNLMHNLVPDTAVSFCTIQDYIGMRLTGRKRPLLTASDAASLGGFGLQEGRFLERRLLAAGIGREMLPECTAGFSLLGRTKEGIPVAAAIGDNQASVIGSVRSLADSVLINIGTGSQVSMGVRGSEASGLLQASEAGFGSLELRPLAGEDYLLAGSSLCGGRAYAALEQFLRRTAEAMTGKPCGPVYGQMDALLTERESRRAEQECRSSACGGHDRPQSGESRREKERRIQENQCLTVDTRFCGTREEPARTGAVLGLTLQNFQPEELIYGVLDGIAEELTGFYEKMQSCGAGRAVRLVGSGNGLRRNRHLVKIFEERFGMPMQIPAHQEEAAYGAALYALTAAEIYPSLADAQRLISYRAQEEY